MADLVAALVAGFRAALRRERLPAPPEPRARVEAPPSLLLQLFAPEQLGSDPEPRAAEKPGFFPAVFGVEQLGIDPPAPPRRRTNWIAFLAKPERLDD